MKKNVLLILSGFALFMAYCSSSKKSASTKDAPAISKMTFETGVKPLINDKCAPCHTIGNKKKLTYEGTKETIDDIIARVHKSPGEKGFMPFKKDKLSDSLINVFVQWKNEGMLEK